MSLPFTFDNQIHFRNDLIPDISATGASHPFGSTGPYYVLDNVISKDGGNFVPMLQLLSTTENLEAPPSFPSLLHGQVFMPKTMAGLAGPIPIMTDFDSADSSELYLRRSPIVSLHSTTPKSSSVIIHNLLFHQLPFWNTQTVVRNVLDF